jgi:hypothetical protein
MGGRSVGERASELLNPALVESEKTIQGVVCTVLPVVL